jgi:DNA-binding NarL/FixJ family response regulator
VTSPGLGQLQVVIADDHELARAGIRLTLEHATAFEVCAEAATADDAVELTLLHRPAIALLDVQMPGGGIQAARRIAAAAPDVTVVMLSVVADDEQLFAALRAGAAGYLRKDMDPDRLPDALLGAIRGEAALARQDVGRIVAEFRRRGDRRVALPDGRSVQLTEREWAICSRLLAGASTRQVALELHVAPVTVRRHVSEVVAKLQVRDRAAALDLLRARRG